MAFFRCVLSGNKVEFKSTYDVDMMRKQTQDYVEVDAKGVPLREEDKFHFTDEKLAAIKNKKKEAIAAAARAEA